MELKKNSWAVETTKPKKTGKPKSTMAISTVAFSKKLSRTKFYRSKQLYLIICFDVKLSNKDRDDSYKLRILMINK